MRTVLLTPALLCSALLLLLLHPQPAASFPEKNPLLQRGLEKIVGGTEVSPKYKYPFITNILHSGSIICGGSLIAPSWVLTAAHCVVGSDPTKFSIYLHRHNIDLTLSAENGTARTVSLVIVGARYTDATLKDDIALFKLSSPVDITPVALDTVGTLATTGTNALIMGWGAIYYKGYLNNLLLEATTKIWSFTDCKNIYSKVVTLESATQICAGLSQGGVDTCQGDSGGPILIDNGSELVQVGIVSFGVGCAEAGIPGVYTSTYGMRNFISSVTADSATFGHCDSNPCPSGAYCYESLDTFVCDAATIRFSFILTVMALVAFFLNHKYL